MKKLMCLFIATTLFLSCSKEERIINQVKSKLEGSWLEQLQSSSMFNITSFTNCNENFCSGQVSFSLINNNNDISTISLVIII